MVLVQGILLNAKDMEFYFGKMEKKFIKIVGKNQSKELEALKKALIKKGVVSENDIAVEKK